MSTDRVLIELATVCAEAAADALRAFGPDGVEVGPPRVMESGADPLANLPVPALAADVSYVDGVTGGNVFVAPLAGARGLARAMLGMDGPADDESAPLDELERSAVAEAMNQMMAAAAFATSGLLGTEVEIAPPRVRDLVVDGDAEGLGEPAPHATVVPITVHGVVCRLVQLVPYAFVVRMTRALDERDAEVLSEGPAVDRSGDGIAAALGAAEVDLWVELGRTKLPAGRLAGVPAGEVFALDHLADDPVDVYVNGLRVGTGRLLVVDGSEWAVRLETIEGAGDDRPVVASTATTDTDQGRTA
ncbi:FliM/FliN family flagellar motor switch protein [Patulibacter minatonensis]|uniref:FliM/FliN family flagellar motor switch protein n=1 Tax=Patulibacter minatonensis TaxID=298163 RepID=UPI00047ECA4E|nr:FliM/FliN family flagellar motor switch protein [Patulibacter minatonensis]